MRTMPHGYTNHTVGDAASVEKAYKGPDAELRSRRERSALVALRGLLPVPAVLATRAGTLTVEFVHGVHGQDLVQAGHAADVLRACGDLLRRLQDLPADLLGLPASAGQVLVHGDFGPNNILFEPGTHAVHALLDWEFAHVGEPVEDLAWCEWIVRTHHPEQRAALGEFHAAYTAGGRSLPLWPVRQAAMVDRCRELGEFCQRWEAGGPGVRQWEGRASATAAWIE
jgi:aminoglycoside phosphotransferase